MTNDEATAIVRIGEKVLAEARALGWLNLSDAEALRARLAAAESSLREAREEAERLKDGLRDAVDLGDRLYDLMSNNERDFFNSRVRAALAAKGEG